MGILTSQKINEYYERFKTIEVTFTKEIIQVTGLIPNQVYLKCVGDFWPCVIFSSSFQGTKIVANIKSGILQKLERANNMVSLRFCFKIAEKGNPVSFFVNAKSTGYASYGGSKDVALFSLQFTQRPPDDLIEIIGRILEANVNSTKRREERILITPESTRKLNILSKDSAVFIQGVPRHCILRDISFSGAKLIMMGVAKFLVDRDGALRVDFDDPRESFLLRGKFIRSEAVEGRKELIALAILFNENIVPMGYKIRINDYLSQLIRADNRGAEKQTVPEPQISIAPEAAPQGAPAGVQPDPEKPGEAVPKETALKEAAPKEAAKEIVSESSAKPEAEVSGDENFDLNVPSS